MTVRWDSKRKRWYYRSIVRKHDGTRPRISGVATRNTKQATEEAERAHIIREERAAYAKPVTPYYGEWFDDHFVPEWVVANKNKPSEVESKESIFRLYLKPFFGRMRVADIRADNVGRFKAQLVDGKLSKKKLSEKRMNNILAVLSKSLKYAEQIELIDKVPRIGLFKVERPSIESWTTEQYGLLLQAARDEGAMWFVAVCLGGEAGLRVGEIRALNFKKDVDLESSLLTVSRQMRHSETGTPKGRTRRTVPMTTTLKRVLAELGGHGEFVVANKDGSCMTDGQATHAIRRICKRAGLSERGWHSLRHTFATDAATFGVNPWSLQKWMGHKRIDETMRYVHLAEDKPRIIPAPVLRAGQGVSDPNGRIMAMLGARGSRLAAEEVT